MKRLQKILITGALIFIVIFLALSIFVCFQGKKIVTARLQVVFEQPIEIGEIRWVLPLSLQIRDLHVGATLRVKEVVVGLGFMSSFNKGINLSQVTLLEPQLVMHRSDDSPPFLESKPQSPAEIQQNTQPSRETLPTKAPRPQLLIKTLVIKSGEIHYIDHVPHEADKAVVIRNINLRAANVALPLISSKTIFNFQATMGRDETSPIESRITGQGWVDAYKRDMESKIVIDDLDSKVILDLLGGEETLLKNAIVDVMADLNSKNNEMQVVCQIKVNELVFRSPAKRKGDSISFEEILIDGLQRIGQGTKVNFRFKTKMDEFKIESMAFSGNVYQDGDPHKQDSEVLNVAPEPLSP